jgi:GNAT superfamily N-acetyltransferase
MTPRVATPDDAREVVRLAAVMYASMGLDVADPEWLRRAEESFRTRLGRDLAAFVVDHPDREGLAASGAGTISTRLPSPNNLTARVGYIQWVATDSDVRRRGFAREVMEALLDWYDEQRVVVVELHATVDGEPLYRELGFGQEGGVALRRRAWDR